MIDIDKVIDSLDNTRGVFIEYAKDKDIDTFIEDIKNEYENVIDIDLNQLDSLNDFIEEILKNSSETLFSRDFESLGCELYKIYDNDFIIIFRNFTLSNVEKISSNFTSQIRSWYDRRFSKFIILANEDLFDIETNLTIAGSLIATTFANIVLNT